MNRESAVVVLRFSRNTKERRTIFYMTKVVGTSALQNNISQYEKFKISNIDHLIETLKSLNIGKQMILFNIKKYGYMSEVEYILNSLGYTHSGKKINVSDRVIKQAEFFNIIFDTEKTCFVRVRNKSTSEYRAYSVQALKDPYKLNAILKSNYFSNNNDMMYSLNTYNNMYKADDNSLFSLHLIAIDVDFDTSTTTLKEALNQLSELYGTKIPTPSFIEWGHRARLLYKIECVGATSKSKKVVQLVTQSIADKIKDLGATGQALTTFARVLGSVNTKDNSKINISLIKSEPYKLRELQDTLLGRPEWLEKLKRANKSSKVVAMQNSYTLNLARLRDLEKLQSIRQHGFREILCYLYRNYCLLANMNKEEAKKAMLKFNDNFNNPLRPNVAEQDTRALERKQYLHKNETILNLLDVTKEEEQRLHLETILSETEYKRRDNEANKRRYRAKVGKDINKSKSEEIEELRAKIKSLRAKGFKNKDICCELDLAESTLKRHITYLKKNGLL